MKGDNSMPKSKITDPRINDVIREVLQASKDTLGDRLEKVILFGSYARGDYDAESDIDFCILANVPRNEATKWRRDINKCMPGIDLEYDMLVSLHVINSSMFYNHVDVLPFYRTVLQEGVELSG
jgi:predicted nucleotidyltransferase